MSKRDKQDKFVQRSLSQQAGYSFATIAWRFAV